MLPCSKHSLGNRAHQTSHAMKFLSSSVRNTLGYMYKPTKSGLYKQGLFFSHFLGGKFRFGFYSFIQCHWHPQGVIFLLCRLQLVLRFTRWLPQLQATLLHSRQKEVGEDTRVFSAPFSFRKPKATPETQSTTPLRSPLSTPVRGRYENVSI